MDSAGAATGPTLTIRPSGPTSTAPGRCTAPLPSQGSTTSATSRVPLVTGSSPSDGRTVRRSVTTAVTRSAGVTSNAGLYAGPRGHLGRVPLLDLDAGPGGVSVSTVDSGAATTNGMPARAAASASGYVPTLLATSPLAAIRSAPTTTASTRPRAISDGRRRRRRPGRSTPSAASSQAVSRAPCSSGRVSSAYTPLDWPRSCSTVTMPSAVPHSTVASQPVLQWVSSRSGRRRRAGRRRARRSPGRPCASSSSIARASASTASGPSGRPRPAPGRRRGPGSPRWPGGAQPRAAAPGTSRPAGAARATPERAGRAQRRRAPDGEPADRVDQRVRVGEPQPPLLARQQGLVDQQTAPSAQSMHRTDEYPGSSSPAPDRAGRRARDRGRCADQVRGTRPSRWNSGFGRSAIRCAIRLDCANSAAIAPMSQTSSVSNPWWASSARCSSSTVADSVGDPQREVEHRPLPRR